jgi:hypothetical protein
MTQQEREALIAQIEALPQQLEELTAAASEEQLVRPYRERGWNARQVIHHLADSHMHAYTRSKRIVAEENPTLQPYNQVVWAGFEDASTGPLEPSLTLLRGMHARWAAFFRSLPEFAWTRTAFHPERGTVTLEAQLQLDANHGARHLGHIRLGLGR